MPGRKIDRFALSALFATALYLYFLNAWRSIPLAGALAFACCALMNAAAARRPVRRRRSAAQADAEITRLACLPVDEAERAVDALLRGRYPDERFELVCLQRYPGGTLSAGDVFGIWRARRGGPPVAIAATCAADPKAIAYARELADPPVAVVDRRALSRLIRNDRTQPERASAPRASVRLRRVLRHALARRVSPKNALMGFVLLAAYLALGNPLCLIAALGLIFLSGASLIQGRGRRRLFG